MTEPRAIGSPVVRIEVRIQVGKELMAATDDPVFLGIEGPDGREFRLAPAKGHALRRGHEDHFVLGAPDDAATNVAHPELNDPTRPPIDVEGVQRIYLRKGIDPIPNVRGLGEMDDRLEVEHIEVVLVAAGNAPAAHFIRSGPLWLGLVCGSQIEIPRRDAGA